VILVRGRSSIYLAGPPLVKAAIGEDTDEESLGGAETHAACHRPRRVPVRERRPRDRHGARSHGQPRLNWDDACVPSVMRSTDARRPTRYFRQREELLGIVPADEREPYDVREIIARLVDASDFLEFKAATPGDTICGHARLHGHKVGILGNNGPIQPDGSVKAAQFIQLCDQSGTPLIFLQNTTGYMVGSAAERAGAIKHGSKMIQAVANARVPSSPSSSAAPTAPATTACAGAASTRASSFPGRRRAPP
jgi:geranyl-CoA carboxylase beta subunit